MIIIKYIFTVDAITNITYYLIEYKHPTVFHIQQAPIGITITFLSNKNYLSLPPKLFKPAAWALLNIATCVYSIIFRGPMILSRIN